MDKSTAEKIMWAFNLLVANKYLSGRYKEKIQEKIVDDVRKVGVKAQANKDSIENLTPVS